MNIKFIPNKKTNFLLICLMMLLIPLKIHAIEYGGLGAKPANPRPDNSRTQSIFLHTINPGEEKTDAVIVSNTSQDTKTVMVYAADSTPSTGGAFACKQFGEPKAYVGTWINLEATELVLAPGESQTVNFTIAAPNNASVGEHNGCILVQQKDQKTTEQAGASIAIRTGIRVALTVPGDIVKDIVVIDIDVEHKKEKDVIVLRPYVENRGNVSVDTEVSVITKNIFGRQVAEHGGRFPSLRGERTDWNFEFKRPFWGGVYRTKVTASYDDLASEIGLESGQELKLVDGPSVTFFVTPHIQALIVYLVVLLVLAGFAFNLLRSVREEKAIKQSWTKQDVKSGDDIQSLAKEYGVSWKLIAKANKLSSPYTLKAGSKILLPPKKKSA